jgi:protein O-GlcNAc transferase
MAFGILKSMFSGLVSRRARGGEAPTLDRAIALLEEGRLESAESVLRALCITAPEQFQPRYLLGYVLYRETKLDAAVAVLEQAIEISQSSADAYYALGRAQIDRSRFADAVTVLRRAVELAPARAPAWLSLADALAAAGEVDPAEDCYLRALALAPELAEVHYGYADLVFRLGRADEAIEHYRKALELKPRFKAAHTNLIYAMNFSDAPAAQEIFREHVAWAQNYAEHLTPAPEPPRRTARIDKRLRIGYVSPNFRDHAVTYFFEPVMRHHDSDAVAVYCYSDVRVPDPRTERLRRYRCVWRDTASLSDEELVRLVRDDGIDILVDLTGHTKGDRLLAFARRAAPVQITWNGYMNTTGMSAMDYRITDVYADPPGTTDRFHTEMLLRMPEIFEPFEEPADGARIGPLPMLERGFVTFASFNAVTKLTPRMLGLWAGILYAVPSSRLLMLAVPEGRTQRRIKEIMAQHGIDGSRLDVRGRVSHSEFIGAHNETDIALDTYPFHGVTTTAHTLWMGMPVVTLAGRSHGARVGVSMLTNVGLSHLIATSDEYYVSLAADLAHDVPQLLELRANLRERMRQAPNMDGARFTRFLEEAYLRISRDPGAREVERLRAAGLSQEHIAERGPRIFNDSL